MGQAKGDWLNDYEKYLSVSDSDISNPANNRAVIHTADEADQSDEHLQHIKPEADHPIQVGKEAEAKRLRQIDNENMKRQRDYSERLKGVQHVANTFVVLKAEAAVDHAREGVAQE